MTSMGNLTLAFYMELLLTEKDGTMVPEAKSKNFV